MFDTIWLVQRLKVMSVLEIVWRVSQMLICKSEYRRIGKRKSSVTNILFNQKLNKLQIESQRMYLNLDNKEFKLKRTIPLLGDYDYEQYKKKWSAGFQTKNKWPSEFSYSLKYKQRDDIGDARTNWELNRHFQFAILAKDFAASGEQKYLKEFQDLFNDWNKKNPFLWGISWTSVMEIAIRCSNWCYAYCFLANTNAPLSLLEELRIGIINMTNYIAHHYSRYSSANNHLIIEAYAVGQTGVLCNYKPWIELAVKILTKQLSIQNYSDGINKELALHYQSFYMEAMGLMMRLLIKNNYKVPKVWEPMLEKMCIYLANCMGENGEEIAFGDNDEGKILDLQGGINYYQYVLGLFSHIIGKQFVDINNIECETLNWLFSSEEHGIVQSKPLYRQPLSVCYKEGGNTVFRSKDRRVLIGIDHAALGFGRIAAHGHADALSFQMYVDGYPIFVDPGTYIYHCDIKSRNAFRKTENHNTVCVEKKDQSEMLGPFLWGKRAECNLIAFEKDGMDILIAQHNGYAPIIHTRSYIFDKERCLKIIDELNIKKDIKINFLLHPGIVPRVYDNQVLISINKKAIKLFFESESRLDVNIERKPYSKKYGKKENTFCIVVNGYIKEIKTRIIID